MFFLSHYCQNRYLHWESESTSPLQCAFQHCAGLCTCCEGNSVSNLSPVLCVLAANVHSYQSYPFLFLLWELSMAFYIFHRHRVCLVDRVDLICSLYSWWEGFGSSCLAILPLGFNCGFISTSACGSSAGVCS